MWWARDGGGRSEIAMSWSSAISFLWWWSWILIESVRYGESTVCTCSCIKPEHRLSKMVARHHKYSTYLLLYIEINLRGWMKPGVLSQHWKDIAVLNAPGAWTYVLKAPDICLFLSLYTYVKYVLRTDLRWMTFRPVNLMDYGRVSMFILYDGFGLAYCSVYRLSRVIMSSRIENWQRSIDGKGQPAVKSRLLQALRRFITRSESSGWYVERAEISRWMPEKSSMGIGLRR